LNNFREFEAIFEKGLTRETGAQMGLFDENTRGRKSRDAVPLNKTFVITRKLENVCKNSNNHFGKHALNGHLQNKANSNIQSSLLVTTKTFICV
jgi:hypothetical protein